MTTAKVATEKEVVQFSITASLTKGNNVQAAADRKAWDQLMRSVRDICGDDKFSGIRPDFV